jgi:hypothetical protein
LRATVTPSTRRARYRPWYFPLTETDLQEVAVCRGVVNKLGFAVQLCTLRWQGYFLGDTRGLPATVLETLARQLGLLAMSIDDYPQNEKTRWEHLERIRQHLRFQQCDDFQRQRLLKHLTETAQAVPRSDALRQEAWRWLQEQRIVRPGRTTLRDLLTAAREGALQHAFALLALVGGEQGGFRIRLERGSRGKNEVVSGCKRSRCSQRGWLGPALGSGGSGRGSTRS